MRQQLLDSTFSYKGTELGVDRHTCNLCSVREYTVYTCSFCDAVVPIASRCVDSYRGMRFAQHLRECIGYRKHVPRARWATRLARPAPTEQRELPSIWPLHEGPAPSPPPSPPPSPAQKKKRRRATPAQSRLRRERRERTLLYKWIEAYAHKID
jgi:hypothetical protein